MGADNFFTQAFGRDVHEAFDNARKDAAWQYGHAGYTGTIAEKGSFVLFELPARIDPRRFTDLLHAAAWHGREPEWEREAVEIARKSGTKEAIAIAEKRCKQAEKEYAKFWKTVPEKHHALIKAAAEVYDDKWGPAVAVEVKGQLAKKLKELHGLKGTRKRVFFFCGYASS